MCTPGDVLAAGISKMRLDIMTAVVSFPALGKCCNSSLHQAAVHSEVITGVVVEVPTQSCHKDQLDTQETLQ